MSSIAVAKAARNYRPAPHCAACAHYKSSKHHAKPWPIRECMLGGFYVSGLAICDDFEPLNVEIYGMGLTPNEDPA